MRKIILISLAVTLSQLVFSQSAEQKVGFIREQYNDAQEVMKFIGSDEWMEAECHTVTIKSRVNYAGGGRAERTIEVLLTRSAESSEYAGYNTFRPWLTRENRTASTPLYREMLFDRHSGELVFCYQRAPLDNGDIGEVRFYYDRGKLIKAVPATLSGINFRSPDEIKESARLMKELVNDHDQLY
ncbi:MAG: hypothetical protein SOZ80_05590 [Prevotella sp.]|uniref:hypothetical protein n=1 Tax=Prevotella sp. TaxID=59823 RepID=UPI002A2828B6|nr:hypothetical protein [Prevotella sp.]MDD7318415.1 hypothetical protein [Prevotellaceae bacterium]MDY4020234.1 hypothetical protein [Prevotella sp.]